VTTVFEECSDFRLFWSAACRGAAAGSG